jgi:predicted CXXCH cytochrome family protein
MWARALTPTGDDPLATACLGCHGPNGPASGKTPGNHSHPVGVPLERLGILARAGRWLRRLVEIPGLEAMRALPLFDGAGRRAPEGGNVSCATCHDPHRWSPAPADPPATEGNAESSFLRIANGQGQLCTNCHRDQTAVLLSKHNLPAAPPAAQALEPGQLQAGACGTCHAPHNATGPRLWAGPTEPTKTGIERLCVGCHRDGGKAGTKQVGSYSHPLHVGLAGRSRQPDLPLFAADGTRAQQGGQVDCATCHDPHQWDPADPASRAGAGADVEGDAGNSFLRLPATGDAALCVQCHREKRLVLGTDHDLAVSAPQALNSHDQDVEQSGICGQCHTVHNAAALRLWARPPGEGQDGLETLCRSCHAPEAIGKDKLPQHTSHPRRLITAADDRLRAADDRAAHVPVFGTDGQPAAAGYITCASCHNPHQWAPGQDQPGFGSNVEGDVLSSFLRNASTERILCTDCHGRDALFRYKYFHWSKSRQPHKLY